MPGMIETLERAAALLDHEADRIKQTFYRGRWMKSAHFPHEDHKLPREIFADYRATAKALRQIAKYHKSNPLGGPAKVFDTMADRIRAGEDYYDVLADHGFRAVPTRKRRK